MEIEYKTSWKSFYKEILFMLILLILAGIASYFKPDASWLKWLLICVCVVDIVIFFSILLKRSMMTLYLRDNPSDPANQEVAFVSLNPFKPWSRDFRKSIEISLANVMHIEVDQNLIQTILNVGDIVITSSGTSEEEICAKNIPSPSAVRDKIQEHARKYSAGSIMGTMPPKTEA